MELTRKTIAKVIVAAFLLNLVVMGAGAWFAYQEAPPIPEEVVGPDGETIATGETVQDGKAAFQQYGLMNHGSILGNGAYYGEDYTAETLDLKTEHMREYYAQEEYGAGYDSLSSPSARRSTRRSATTSTARTTGATPSSTPPRKRTPTSRCARRTSSATTRATAIGAFRSG